MPAIQYKLNVESRVSRAVSSDASHHTQFSMHMHHGGVNPIHSFIYSFIHSFIHAFIHSFIHISIISILQKNQRYKLTSKDENYESLAFCVMYRHMLKLLTQSSASNEENYIIYEK